MQAASSALLAAADDGTLAQERCNRRCYSCNNAREVQLLQQRKRAATAATAQRESEYFLIALVKQVPFFCTSKASVCTRNAR